MREVIYVVCFLGRDKFCLLSSRLRSGVNGTYASFGHSSGPGSRSAPRDTSRASPSVLETKKCCNSWSASVVTPKSWRFDSEILLLPFFLHATLPVSAVHTPHQQRPLPSTTRVSNSGCPSARNDLASKLFRSTNPYVASCRISLRKTLISCWIVVLRELLDVLSLLFCNWSCSARLTPSATPKS